MVFSSSPTCPMLQWRVSLPHSDCETSCPNFGSSTAHKLRFSVLFSFSFSEGVGFEIN